MALTPEQTAQVNRLKAVAPTGTLTDDQVWAIIVEEGSFNKSAAYFWESEAKSSARYLDMAEGSSRRNLSTIHKNAVSMAEYYGGKADADAAVATGGRTMTRGIRRAPRVDS